MDSKNAHKSVINLVSTYLIRNKYEGLDDSRPTFCEKTFKVRKNQWQMYMMFFNLNHFILTMLHIVRPFWKLWNESCWTFEKIKDLFKVFQVPNFAVIYTLDCRKMHHIKNNWGIPQTPWHKRGLLLPPPPATPRGAIGTPCRLRRVYWHSKWYRHDVELEEHTGCANAHYLRKSVVYNNNNASSVFYPPRIFTISIIMYIWFLMHNDNVVSTTMFVLKSPNIGRDAYSFSMQWYHCYFFNTRPFNFATLRYWRAQFNFQ